MIVKGPDVAYGVIKDISRNIRCFTGEKRIEELTSVILNNANFYTWSGSSTPKHHHYGKHGLIVHTKEVIKLCLKCNTTTYACIDQDKLFLAALFHDIGKIHDYRPLDEKLEEWESTEHKTKIHHIYRSAAIWEENAKRLNYKQDYIDDVSHAILAHHGCPEWGSPVKPQTKLAWLLHLCDNISAQMYNLKKAAQC